MSHHPPVPAAAASATTTSRVGGVSRLVAKNAAVRAAADLIGKVATLAWTVIAVRALTQQDFGAFSYALALMLLVSSFPAWGFDPVLIRRGSVAPDLLTRLHTEAIAWQTLLAVPVFVLVGLLATASRPSAEATAVLAIVLLAGVPELWSDTARAAASARQEPAGVAVALILQRLTTAVFIVGAVWGGLGVLGAACGFLAGTLVGWTAHVAALRRMDIHVRLSALSWPGMREMLREARLLGLSAVVLVVLFRVDAVLLEAFKGDEAVATYAVAYRLLETVLFVAWAIRQAVLPVMSTSSTGVRVRVGYERGMAAAAFVYLPFAAVCLIEAEQVLDLLFGSMYAAESAPMLRWLALAPMVFTGAFLGFSVLVASKRSGVLLAAALVSTAVNIVLNLLLIPPLSGVGAAIATTVSYGVLVGIVLATIRGTVGRIRVLRPLAEAAVASALFAGLLLVMHLPLVFELAIGAVGYLGAWVILVRQFAPEQLGVLRSLVPGAGS